MATGSAVAMNVMLGTITSSPGPTPKVLRPFPMHPCHFRRRRSRRFAIGGEFRFELGDIGPT